MLANYHTHTYLCHHASGKPEEYVEKAIENGLKILGFSDHVPMPYSKPDYVSRSRMSLAETELYVNTVLGLKEKYKDDITIYLGYEAEYLPREFENMIKHLTSFPIDYLILGQHFSYNEYDGQYFGMPFLKEKALVCYVDQAIAGMESGMFTYLAHPDLPNFIGFKPIYQREMKRLIEAANRLEIPMEFNLLGLATHRNYPNDTFWKMVSEMGGTVVLGCDAHQVDMVGNKEIIAAGEKKLAQFGLKATEDFPLKKVRQL